MKLVEGNSLVLALDHVGNPGAWLNNEMAEHLILSGKTILADQMEFLRARVRRR